MKTWRATARASAPGGLCSTGRPSWFGCMCEASGSGAAGAFWVYFVFALWYHVGVMAIGQCMTSFFAVWTVHHDCDRSHAPCAGR